jgi:hypothetical protein
MRKWQQRRGEIMSVGGDISCRELGNKTAIELEKMESRNRCKKSILDKNSPFFLHCLFVYGDAREWHERCGEIMLVGGDIPRHELGNKTAIELKNW